MHDVVSPKTPLTRGLFFGDWRFNAATLAVLLLCLVPFFPGAGGPFQLDDRVNLESVHVTDTSPSGIFDAAFRNTSGPLGRPVSALSLIGSQLAHGYDPTGYKVANLAIHLANGVLAFALGWFLLGLLQTGAPSRRLRWVALLAAAIWTIHPLQVSTALYVVQRMTELASGLMMVAVLVAIRSLGRRHALPATFDGMKLAVAVGAIALIAVLCKETGVLVPFLLLAVGVCLPLASWQRVTNSTGKRTFWWTAVALPIALSVVATVLLWDRITSGFESRPFTLAERLLTEPLVLGGYLKSFFVPNLRTMGLFLDATPVVSPGDPFAWAGPLALLVVVTLAVAFRRKTPLFAFAVLWFLACHLLESSFLPLEVAFEHRNYLALLGPSLLLAAGIAKLAALSRPRVSIVVAVALLLTLGGMTFVRSSNWSDQQTFLVTSLRHHPESVRAQTEFAIFESQYGYNSVAITRVRGVRERNPDLFFPMAMDMDFGCAMPEYAVDWAAILERVRARPRDLNITGYYKSIATRLIGEQCPGDIRSQFESHLDDVIGIYRAAGRRNELQFFLMIKADLQEDPERKRELLQRAHAAAPGNPAALYRMAYVALNAGNASAADAAIRQLDARTSWWSPSRYRVDELERFLVDLRDETPLQ